MENKTSRIETITPVTAIEYLKKNGVNRPLNKEKVNEYANYMSKGQWRLNGEAICFFENGMLSNGQHRLNAIIQSGCSIRTWVTRGCDNDSFYTYDSGMNRKISDVFSIAEIHNANNISGIVSRYFYLQKESLISFGDGGYNGAMSGFNRKSKKDYLNEYNNSPELYQQAVSVANKFVKKLNLLKRSEIGGLYVFLIKDKKYDVDIVYSFFDMLFFYNKNSINVINLLRDKLINNTLSNSKFSSKYKYNLIVKTWNYYIQGKDVTVLRYNEATEGKLSFL